MLALLKKSYQTIYVQLKGNFRTVDFLDKKYIPSLDGWRAIAILMVILGHAKVGIQKDSIYFGFLETFIYSELGVRIFFVLSGFLITSLLIKEYQIKGHIDVLLFLKRRALRILPVLYLYLVIIFVLNQYFQIGIRIESFIPPLFFIYNFVLANQTWLTGHTWSLGIEEQFYLLWPVIFIWLKEYTWKFCFIVILAMPILRIFWYYKRMYYGVTLGPFFYGADAIFFGGLVSMLCFKGIINSKQHLWHMPVIQIAAMILLFLTYYCQHLGLIGKIFLPFGGLIGDVAIIYLILFSVINTSGIIYKFLNHKIILKTGVISYSLYVWQQLFMLPNDYALGTLPRFIFPFNILVSFIVAYLSYHYFEIHFLKMKNKVMTKKNVNLQSKI